MSAADSSALMGGGGSTAVAEPETAVVDAGTGNDPGDTGETVVIEGAGEQPDKTGVDGSGKPVDDGTTSADGQSVPKTWTEAIKEIHASNKDLAKEIREAYFRNKQLGESFPDDPAGTPDGKSGIQKAIEAKEQIELANEFKYTQADGTELAGLEGYKKHVEDIVKFDQAFMNSDPKFARC